MASGPFQWHILAKMRGLAEGASGQHWPWDGALKMTPPLGTWPLHTWGCELTSCPGSGPGQALTLTKSPCWGASGLTGAGNRPRKASDGHACRESPKELVAELRLDPKRPASFFCPRGGPAEAWAVAMAPTPSGRDPDLLAGAGTSGSWSSSITTITWSLPQARQGWFFFSFLLRKHF